MIRELRSCVSVGSRILSTGRVRLHVVALLRSTPGVLRATFYNSRPAIALTTSRTKRLGVRSSAFVPRTSALGLIPLS